jgi:phenylacetic acid degradation operon negative regulatory protein
MWDLTAWAERADDLRRALDALAPERPEALAPGFELSAAVLRHLQGDPLLPAELLPAHWPGAALRAAYGDWDTRYRATLRDWSRS